MTKPLSIDHQHLDSLDEFNLGLRSAGWDAEFRQLNRGLESASIAVLATDRLRILKVHMGNSVHQLGVPPEGYLSFGLMATPQRDGRFGRHAFNASTLVNFNTLAGLDAVSAGGFLGYGMSVHHSLLEGAYGDRAAEEVWANAGALKDINGLAEGIRQIIDNAFAFAGSDALAEGSHLFSPELEAELSRALNMAWVAGEEPLKLQAAGRARVLAAAVEFINTHVSEPFTLARLCSEIGTSISTLERVFLDQFGLSPKRYLQVARLSAVRRSLLDPEDGRSVSDVADAWGFWHKSKFAADYRQEFGELPSSTRRTA